MTLVGNSTSTVLPPGASMRPLALASPRKKPAWKLPCQVLDGALPAVAVRASGVDEVVADGETGVLSKPEAGEIADAAIGLLLDPERRAAMSQAARRLAETRFSARRQIEAMVGHYDGLLARGR